MDKAHDGVEAPLVFRRGFFGRWRWCGALQLQWAVVVKPGGRISVNAQHAAIQQTQHGAAWYVHSGFVGLPPGENERLFCPTHESDFAVFPPYARWGSTVPIVIVHVHYPPYLTTCDLFHYTVKVVSVVHRIYEKMVYKMGQVAPLHILAYSVNVGNIS